MSLINCYILFMGQKCKVISKKEEDETGAAYYKIFLPDEKEDEKDKDSYIYM